MKTRQSQFMNSTIGLNNSQNKNVSPRGKMRQSIAIPENQPQMRQSVIKMNIAQQPIQQAPKLHKHDIFHEITHSFGEFDKKVLMQLYDLLLQDQSAEITPKDIKKVFLKMGHKQIISNNPSIPKKYLYQIIRDFDIDESGQIGFGEFIQMMQMRPCDNEQDIDIERCFRELDLFDNGYITEDDLNELADECQEPRPNKELMKVMLQVLGADSEGKVHYNDFKQFNRMVIRRINFGQKNSIHTY